MGGKFRGEPAAVGISPEKLCGRTVACNTDYAEVIFGILFHVLKVFSRTGNDKYSADKRGCIKAGRNITDDVVEIRKVSDETLIGSAPNITKHFIELRGVGIIDVKNLYGVSSVKETQGIDLVIHLEDWSKDKEYDRLGLEEEYTEYLGNKVVCHNIPIRPGRNVAVICETAAINHRQKKMGYNAAQELYKRVQASLSKRRDEED